ncbi:diacylglycerol/lipid kinase family protein [Mobiluncus curtisii]|uniref:Lipid kinase BmrU n=2 Tax=Mobiluncus curtisii TaxID=2051 RepID=A0A2X2YJM1_9ACTO|nr:diacylglycerol kinase family protein [Mobiluncus curtisii]EFL92876.1 lipid kinase, YegS/Rv2252/BmrU family [Mobiluncus curtisii subsp. curtisii ATCC 35241]MCV0020826.1 diacylglycerol kinase family lipid kinase [Mobiluncus curtisii]NMW47123.1 diacylglycerol kinase family lipid kinase [Mobiluncus curtisii]QQT13474.1 diacylglycerol kinase family lipid kinase [Mobiluncus curtisii]QQU08112.1 diacylglycerol kinase family lipid kinase [Mobiluncus curtisii]
MRQVVTIYNPVKVGDEDEFKTSLSAVAQQHGFVVKYLTTSVDDPGFAMAAQARKLQPDLVIAAGGDGTVRVVSTEMRHSEIPVAVLPAGTTNLLARNLNVPLDMKAAMELAFTGQQVSMDIVKVHNEKSRKPWYFTGMAGIGIDAEVMHHVDEGLKKVVGPVAYVMSFFRQVNNSVQRCRFRIDGKQVLKRNVIIFMVGNTSQLTGGIQLFPEATPFDGSLDLLIGAPQGISGWWRVVKNVVLRLGRRSTLEYFSGKRFEVLLHKPAVWEMDGDPEAAARHWVFQVVPQAITVVAGEPGPLARIRSRIR